MIIIVFEMILIEKIARITIDCWNNVDYKNVLDWFTITKCLNSMHFLHKIKKYFLQIYHMNFMIVICKMKMLCQTILGHMCDLMYAIKMIFDMQLMH